MLVFPNAKINIGLHVSTKRPDGYHALESCFYPVSWTDALEILPAAKTIISFSGIPVPGDPETNLCLKAYLLLKNDFELPPVQIHLHKHIPIGAGLGGGSADAAFTLKTLNQQFNLNISDDALENYARLLGSDCAFFIRNKPVLAFERGDVFEKIELDLSTYKILLVYPDVHITTAEAYKKIIPKKPETNLKNILCQPVKTWKDNVLNDFEKALFPDYPVLSDLKQKLYDRGAVYASMSGSGSAVYGIFEEKIPETLLFPEKYSVWQGSL